MLKVRLQRVGRKHEPAFRVVLTDSQAGPKSGNVLEVLGSYHAKTGVIELNEERITHHLNLGAQASDTVHNLLVTKKIITGKKVNSLPKKSPIVKEKTEEEIEAEKKAEEAKATAEAEVSTESKEEEKTEVETTPEAEPTPAPAEEEKKEEATA